MTPTSVPPERVTSAVVRFLSRSRFTSGPGRRLPGADAGSRPKAVTPRLHELGRAAVASGWRSKVTELVAPAVAERTPVQEENARAILGLAFVGVSVYYLVATLRRFRSRTSS